MAFFGSNFSKPGPGVGKDEREKTALFRFFDVLVTKFWDLIKINMLYFVFIVLFYVPIILVGMAYLFDKDLLTYLQNNLLVYLILFACALPIVVTGPFTAGFTFVLRNFVRSEHVFLWSDFKDTAKANIKQSMLATLINLVVYMLIGINMIFYLLGMSDNMMMAIPFALSLMAFFIFFSMNYYINIMIITFDLKLKQIYKNAFIFSVLGVFRNILMTVILAAIIALPIFMTPILVLIPFFTLSFMGLVINFGAWPLISKYMIDNASEDKTEAGSDRIFRDVGREKKQKS